MLIMNWFRLLLTTFNRNLFFITACFTVSIFYCPMDCIRITGKILKKLISAFDLNLLLDYKMNNTGTNVSLVNKLPFPVINGKGDIPHFRVIMRRIGDEINPVAIFKFNAGWFSQAIRDAKVTVKFCCIRLNNTRTVPGIEFLQTLWCFSDPLFPDGRWNPGIICVLSFRLER